MSITSTTYLDLSDANDLADTLPPLSGWAGASDDEKTRALLQASADIDVSMPFQGRKYDTDQILEFPRRAYDDPPTGALTGVNFDASSAPVVWDWDSDANEAIVPPAVQTATLYQADSIQTGDREARLDVQHDGVVYNLTGTLAESYKQTPGNGVRTGLCRRAWMLMRKYRRRSGELL